MSLPKRPHQKQSHITVTNRRHPSRHAISLIVPIMSDICRLALLFLIIQCI